MSKSKNKILTYLINHPDQIVSGQELADQLGISRTAVWKAINTLKDSGIPVESKENQGYLLPSSHDIVSEESLAYYFKQEALDINVYYYPTIGSTNTTAKTLATESVTDQPFVVISEEQTAGRGRYDRPFYSPEKSGIYFTIRFKANDVADNVGLITTAAAVAVSQAITELYDITPQIKWVNDLFINGKKICGILTEGVYSMETGQIEELFVGIGINIGEPKTSFPDELQHIAGSIIGDNQNTVNRAELVSVINREFFQILKQMHSREFLKAYRDQCFIIGQPIEYSLQGQTYSGTAVDIDNNANLLVKRDDGTMDTLYYGEVTLHKNSKTEANYEK